MQRAAVIVIALVLAPPMALFAYSLTASRRLRATRADERSCLTIDDAVRFLRESSLTGWPLVEAAQQLVARSMSYSRRNSWDSPRRAFARGMGYCHQRALALQLILRQLGLSASPVFASSCRFPAASIHEYEEPERIAGHVWLRVNLGGKELDVCPGDPTNSPGVVHFTPLSRVKQYRGLARLGGQLGSIYVNTKSDNAAVRRHRQSDA